MIDIISKMKELNFILSSKEISPAKPRITQETIPYRSGSFDFSKITGEYIYNNRLAKLEFSFINNSPTEIHNTYNYIQTMLLENSLVKIKFKDIEGYYIGEITYFSDFKDFNVAGNFKINIDLQPFRFADYKFGEDIWDDFNFNIDVTEYNSYEINESKDIILVNTGISISPNLICDSNMTLLLNNNTFNLYKGENNIKRLKLKNGENKINVKGNGFIKFNFRKEML